MCTWCLASIHWNPFIEEKRSQRGGHFTPINTMTGVLQQQTPRYQVIKRTVYHSGSFTMVIITITRKRTLTCNVSYGSRIGTGVPSNSRMKRRTGREGHHYPLTVGPGGRTLNITTTVTCNRTRSRLCEAWGPFRYASLSSPTEDTLLFEERSVILKKGRREEVE